MIHKFLKLFFALIIFSIILFVFTHLSQENISVREEIIICIDPGHGGKPEFGNRFGGDQWSSENKTFNSFYNYGAELNDFHEHEYVYELGEKVMEELLLLNTEEGIQKAYKFLSDSGINFLDKKNIIFKPFLSRSESYDKRQDSEEININKFFRLFDSPVDPREENFDIFPGRLSNINKVKPHLTLSLHINYVESQKYSGFHSFFAPSFHEFKYIYDNRNDVEKIKKHELFPYWNVSSVSRSIEDWMINDSRTYFTGFRNTGHFIGRRNTMVTWKYNEMQNFLEKEIDTDLLESNFFEREKSKYEKWRRSGGHEGIGGDNLYLSQESLRWISYLFAVNNKIDVNILEPRASDFSIAIYNNSITAGMELGNIYSERDRKFLIENSDEIARYMAYSMLCILNRVELSDKNTINNIIPKTNMLDLKKYGNYFK
ncbi:MAG: hypothetical protein WC337_08095 [Candidatus Muiribacteriota bacterium]